MLPNREYSREFVIKMSKSAGGGEGSCFSDSGRVCTTSGSAVFIIGLIYLIICFLLRTYVKMETLPLFETVPTYIPAISYGVCGAGTIIFAFKRFRNFCLLRLTAFLSFCNSILSSVITLAVVFVNLKVYNAMDVESCGLTGTGGTCNCVVQPFSPAFPKENTVKFETTDCPTGLGVLSSCLLLQMPTSIVAVGISIFVWRFLNELAETT